MYDAIISFANKITDNSKEGLFVRDLKNKWKQAYRTENNNLNGKKDYSKGKLLSGEDVIVSDDINGAHPSKIKAKQSLKSMLGLKYLNQSINNEISIENKDIKKYLNDGYHNYKSSDLKKRIAGNYGEILEIAKIDNNKSQPNYKGTNRGKQGYDYYGVNLAYPIKNEKGKILDYKYYESRLVVRKDNNSNFAYDLDNFMQKKGATLDKSSLSIVDDKSSHSSFSIDNIPQSNNSVKSDTSSTKYSMQESENNTKELDNSSFNLKEKQNKIIQNSNPAGNETATWIRKADNIKIFKETLQDSDYKEYSDVGEDFDESYTADMAKKALETGEITVYSSYPIKQGIFVTPSKIEASQYAGGDVNKTYSKVVPLTDVAWIDPTQGQYVKSDTKYSLSNTNNQRQTIEQLVNESIKYNGENGRIDIDDYAQQENMRDQIWSEFETKFGRELTDEDFELIDDVIDGFYVSPYYLA